ncbi:MAG: MFS transporter [Chloroflexi bacterium]|nr:MFS transporter [Chloroflexota bacterium]
MIPAIFKNKTARGLTILYVSTLMAGLGWSMVFPIIPRLTDEFNVSAGVAVQIVTFFGLGRIVGTPVAGMVVDRIGSRLALIAGPVLVGLGGLASIFTPWFLVILAAAFLVGVGESLWAFGREIAGIDLVNQDQRGRVLSGFHGIHGAGLAVGPLFGGILADAIGLRVVFVAIAVESVAAVALGTMVANSRRQARVAVEASGAPAPTKTSRSPVGWARSIKGLVMEINPGFRTTYITLVFATFAGFLFRNGYQSLLPVFADQELGLSSTEIGALFSFAGIIVLLLTLPAGFIIDKVGRKWATVPSTALPGIAFLLVPFAHSFLFMVPLVIMMGVANGLSLGSLATSTYDVIPAAARGRLQALRRAIADVGGIGAPALGGLLTNLYGPTVPFVVYAPILLLAGLALVFGAKETLVKKPKESPIES